MERWSAWVLGKTTVSCLWTPLDLITLFDDLDQSKFPAWPSESWNPDSTSYPSVFVCHEGCWELTWVDFNTGSKTVLWLGCPSLSQRWMFGGCLFFLGSFWFSALCPCVICRYMQCLASLESKCRQMCHTIACSILSIWFSAWGKDSSDVLLSERFIPRGHVKKAPASCVWISSPSSFSLPSSFKELSAEIVNLFSRKNGKELFLQAS